MRYEHHTGHRPPPRFRWGCVRGCLFCSSRCCGCGPSFSCCCLTRIRHEVTDTTTKWHLTSLPSRVIVRIAVARPAIPLNESERERTRLSAKLAAIIRRMSARLRALLSPDRLVELPYIHAVELAVKYRHTDDLWDLRGSHASRKSRQLFMMQTCPSGSWSERIRVLFTLECSARIA